MLSFDLTKRCSLLAEGVGPPSLLFQSISPGNYLQFAADSFFDRNDGMHLEYESGKHRTEFVNGHRIVTFHQHMPIPLANSYYEEFNLEIGRRLPLTEHLENSLLGILVLHGRTLRAFEPADHVLHRHPPCRDNSAALLQVSVAGTKMVTSIHLWKPTIPSAYFMLEAFRAFARDFCK